MEHLYLAQLKEGEKGKIKLINKHCRRANRLYELGIKQGLEFTVFKKSSTITIIKSSEFKIAISNCLTYHIILY